MRLIFLFAIVVSIAVYNFGCGSKGTSAKTFCDTTCMKDSLKFTGEHNLKPYLYISSANCSADTLTWSYKGMGVNRKMSFVELLNKTVRLNKDHVKCFLKDTAYAWLIFNDCESGRGYQLKIPFDKTSTIGRKNTGINSFDPKFSVSENLVAYSDRGNIIVEEMATGKKATMTFGKDIGIEFNALHEYIDSVNITPTRIWAKVKIDNEWKELEKKIKLE